MNQFYPQICKRIGTVPKAFQFATSKIICVGRNYVEHAQELNNPVPTQPLLFIKPSSCLVHLNNPFSIPTEFGECQHELELALLIGQEVNKSTQNTLQSVAALGLALDLTLRELQSKLKSKGQPWERSKSFDGACPVSQFVMMNSFEDWQNISFSMDKNGQKAQSGNSRDMIFDFEALIGDISSCFTLYPGDIVLTGTPKGVAKLTPGDRLDFCLQNERLLTTSVI